MCAAFTPRCCARLLQQEWRLGDKIRMKRLPSELRHAPSSEIIGVINTPVPEGPPQLVQPGQCAGAAHVCVSAHADLWSQKHARSGLAGVSFLGRMNLPFYLLTVAHLVYAGAQRVSLERQLLEEGGARSGRRTCRLYCRVGIGFHLQIHPDGKVNGSHEPNPLSKSLHLRITNNN